MTIHKITPSVDTINGWDFWIVNLMNQPIKIKKYQIVKQINKKMLLKTMGTSAISPPSLFFTQTNKHPCVY